jgi:hypothetical protein
VDGTGIDLSAVGSGRLTALGKFLSDDGTVAVDGGIPQSIDSVSVLTYGKGNSSSVAKGRNG